ncbi:hypothetical protein Q8A64_11695, partial [Oxalobacteraceae bacterium R-40]|nr:hypothetical protein [Oxalobacteraceae bacterium R-40]
ASAFAASRITEIQHLIRGKCCNALVEDKEHSGVPVVRHASLAAREIVIPEMPKILADWQVSG